MSNAIRRAVMAMACAPNGPGWEEKTREQRALAVFAHVMTNANAAAMQEIVWGGDWVRAQAYRSCLIDVGAGWVGKAILSLALGKPGLLAKAWLFRQCQRLSAEQEALWRGAIDFALAHDALHLKLVR